MTATAAILEVPARANEASRHAHYEIEWRGPAGTFTSGQWYATYQRAKDLAVACGAKDIVDG